MRKAISKEDAKQLEIMLRDIPPPTHYDISRVKLAALECTTVKEFSEFLEVNPLVFKHWVNTNIAFKNAYKSWRDHATNKVEASLAKKAIGFTKITKKQILTRQGQVVELINEEYFPPDTSAAQFWLKNRLKEDWKEASQIDVNVQADIRAWLVNAMSDKNPDESEIIDVTPQPREPTRDYRNDPVTIGGPSFVGTIPEPEPDYETTLIVEPEIESEATSIVSSDHLSEANSETALETRNEGFGWLNTKW